METKQLAQAVPPPAPPEARRTDSAAAHMHAVTQGDQPGHRIPPSLLPENEKSEKRKEREGRTGEEAMGVGIINHMLTSVARSRSSRAAMAIGNSHPKTFARVRFVSLGPPPPGPSVLSLAQVHFAFSL